MSCHNKLQQLCRKYLKKLYRKARDIGLDEFAEKVLIDPLNIELIADALDVSGGTRFHFPKDDSKGIKITFYDKELLLSEALLMPKLDY